MSEQFKLVFRGEIEDDQHLAVVRKRLGALLKADDKSLAALFSGRAVVLRRDIDAAGAAKFQAAFKKAGAKLRVIPHRAPTQDAPAPAAGSGPSRAVAEAPGKPTLAERLRAAEGAAQTEASPPQHRATAPQPAPTESNATDAEGLRLYPVGADLLETHEQAPLVLRNVDVSHLTLAEVGELLGPVVEMMADTERFLAAAAAFELAETGVDMAPAELEVPALPVRPDLGLAPAGAELLEGVTIAPPPEVRAPALDLSEPGAPLVEPAPPSLTDAPDTSHLELVAEPKQD